MLSLSDPFENESMPLSQAALNAYIGGPYYMKPSGIYPPPMTRYPPTHRSADRQIWAKVRLQC